MRCALCVRLQAEVLSSLSHRNIVQFFGAVTVAPNYCIATGTYVDGIWVGGGGGGILIQPASYVTGLARGTKQTTHTSGTQNALYPIMQNITICWMHMA